MNEMIEARTQTSKDRPYRTIEDGDDGVDNDDRHDNNAGDNEHYGNSGDDKIGDDDDVIEMVLTSLVAL
jgi:hypothetical protein